MYKEIARRIRSAKSIYVMTGAGISAPSNIPTFRGTDGMWTNMGSQGKDPTLLLTRSIFDYDPKILWNWFTDFKALIINAKPNEAHFAVLKLQEYCKVRGVKFSLVTQNVDGLHPLLIRKSKLLKPAGKYVEGDKLFGFTEGVLEIHGNADYIRCSEECNLNLVKYPKIVKENEFPRCPKCGSPMRPHTLLFDECYREDLYKSQTALEDAENADCMIVVGSELMTNLPDRIVYGHVTQGKLTVEVNPRQVIAWDSDLLYHISESCEKSLPKLVQEIISPEMQKFI